jgi:hypothetical protein
MKVDQRKDGQMNAHVAGTSWNGLHPAAAKYDDLF